MGHSFSRDTRVPHSILAVANLIANNNVSKIRYCDQITLQILQFSDNLTPLGVTYILLVMVHDLRSYVFCNYRIYRVTLVILLLIV